MRNLILAASVTLGAMSLAPAAGAAGGVDVGVSVQISQPGVYGRVDIGRFPQPQLVVPQPVIIAAPPPPPRPGVVVIHPAPPPQPVYMWVPPGHRKDWRKHCGKYNACGVPVYFVRDEWYDRNVHPEGKKRGKGRGRDDDDDHRGHGRGHGKRD
jgi:hypothetical protein